MVDPVSGRVADRTESGREDHDRVTIFDTTLRDGEQSPGASMTLPEKLRVAAALCDLGVDVIEAGFPAASPGDAQAVERIALEFGASSGPVIAGLARCTEGDIRTAANAVAPAARRRIHVFLATSAIHREFKLKMAREEIVRRARDGVAMARGFADDIEFSPEDASRTEPDFLAEVVEAAIEAGATTINIPDTVGYAMPAQYGDVFRALRETVRGIDRVTLSAHCHDDLGMAVANSLAAIEAGARQVECTINGIGERAGNASLEEIVMALRTRQDHFGVRTGIETRRLLGTSQLVAEVTSMPVARHKAVVGRNAFAHEAGIHQHGVLANRETYEIMRAEDVGFASNELHLGKHSGRHAFRDRLATLGHSLPEAGIERAFAAFKQLADEQKHVTDDDIQRIVGSVSAAISAEAN